MQYSRQYLIKLCERSIVSVKKWNNRDTPSSQEKIGQAWALLKAGCKYKMRNDIPLGSCIWIDIYYPQFTNFERGFDHDDISTLSVELFYIPKKALLDNLKGNDWY